MEQLIKQTNRVRFSAQQREEALSSARERRVPLQKAPSFKEEKKRPQNWFRRQISWKMNQDYDFNEIERATAVAAAACAIASLEESSSTQEQKKIRTEPSLPRNKSRKEVSRPEPDLSRNQESKVPEPSATEEKSPVKIVGPASFKKKIQTVSDKPDIPMKKIRTFAEEQLSRNDDKQPKGLNKKTDFPAATSEIEAPKPDWNVPAYPARSPAKVDRQTSTKLGIEGTEADAWETAKLAKIKEKHEAVEARILSWESKKKTKSRHQLDKSEGDLERKRFKALEKFRSEVEDINQIAEGARLKARKEREHEELKAKENAENIRKTGKAPTTCFCF
ncbi:remorin 1.4-like isoform X2 [Mercurialis annua]|uniref:remorin 1.4-like isoform X2 n=1 Tax=Mercurialis annua TaxID=3986 RepID=UPI00215EB28C|nr:remorin 1.4-like isoform X2 [Mercurialis annua]